jgi:hypothetical protein
MIERPHARLLLRVLGWVGALASIFSAIVVVAYLLDPDAYPFGTEGVSQRYTSPAHYLGIALVEVTLGLIVFLIGLCARSGGAAVKMVQIFLLLILGMSLVLL